MRRVGGVRPLAELVPVLLLDAEPEMLGGRLDVGERLVALGVGDVVHLVEPGQRVLHVPRVGQRLLALVRKRVGAVGQVPALLAGQSSMPTVGLPGNLHAPSGTRAPLRETVASRWLASHRWRIQRSAKKAPNGTVPASNTSTMRTSGTRSRTVNSKAVTRYTR